ncbi:MAG: flagellar hook-length control protein FliK [Hyphomonadaceae bacterium]
MARGLLLRTNALHGLGGRMDFTASAVLDVAAPPARAEARPARGDERAFREHLDAMIEAPAEDAPEPAPDSAARAPESATAVESEHLPEHASGDTDAQSPPEAALLGGPLPSPPPQQAQPHAPLAVQLLVAQAQSAPDAARTGIATPAPALTAPAEAALANAAPTNPAPAMTHAPAAQAPKQLQGAAKANAAGKEAPALAQAQPAALAAPAQQTALLPAATPAAQPPVAAQTTATPAALNAIAAAATPTDPRAAPAPQLAKGAQPARGAEAKAFAADSPAVRAPIVKGGAKTTAPIASAVKDAGAPIAQLADSAPQTSVQPLAATAQHAAQTQGVALDHGAARTAPAATQVAREIVRRFDGESTRFELRLDPPELGRIEVRLEVSRDNRVTAVIAADNPQALTELARHARDLEQQLQSAGLELGDNGLSFDLRQGAQSEQDAQTASDSARGGAPGASAQQDTAPTRAAVLERWRGVRVDVMA